VTRPEAEPAADTWESWGTREIRQHRVARRLRRGRRVILAILLVLVVGGIVGMAGMTRGSSATAAPVQQPPAEPVDPPAGPLLPYLSSSPDVAFTETPGPVPAATKSSPRGQPTTAHATQPPNPVYTTEPPRFEPMGIEAENGLSVLTGGATRLACPTCSGGSRVGFVGCGGEIVVVTKLVASSLRTVRVTYETDGARELHTKINDFEVDVRSLDGSSWEVPLPFEFTATLPAGPVQIGFYNDASSADPDIDRVDIR
jgi:hypothetical protein